MAEVRVVHRKSDTGEFTTKKFADKHPKTTEKQRIKYSSPKKK